MHSVAEAMEVEKGSLKRSFEAMTANSESTLTPLNFKPREYQRKVFEVAMKRNTIAVLETGAGKTMISVMIIKEMTPLLSLSPQKNLFVFLAPTVQLVRQQFNVIQTHTNLKVQEYYGDKGVDEWDAECWGKEINEHDVLVMTPQILLDALRKAFLDFRLVCLLILDECHRATGNHPYSRIMQEFYHKSNIKPKVFGMTASPVIRKVVSSMTDCNEQILNLEGILDSQVITVENRTELEETVPSAIETCNFYSSSAALNLGLKEKLKSSKEKFEEMLYGLEESVQYLDQKDKCKTILQRLRSDYEKILHCLEDLGLLCALEAVQICLENGPTAAEEGGFCTKVSLQQKYFLEEVLSIVSTSLPKGSENFWDTITDCSTAVSMGYISSKLFTLFQTFQSFGDTRQVLCLIFVDRIITAKTIERIMKKIASFSHFTVSYLTGSTTSADALTPRVQKETLELFRSGKVNLLFSTDVVEEGIHVPNCSSVIRFDLPKTVRSYVQSRGRARQKDSQFIMLLESGNLKQREHAFNLVRSEYSMKNAAINRDPVASSLRSCAIKVTEAYTVDSTGASVTMDSSVNLIHKYCEKLPGDKYFVPKPNFHFFTGESYQCQLTLPPNAAFQTLLGPQSRNRQLAKQLVCFEACKKLHMMGAFSDHLLPIVEASKNDSDLMSKGSSPGAGTTKRKELHGTTPVRALSGSWGQTKDYRVFYAYTMHFTCSKPEERFSSFVLLTESKLDDDVGNVEVDLYLVSKFVKSSVASCREMHLDAYQVARAMCFQEFFFNGLFGKLFVRTKSAEGRKFLLQMEESLWYPSYMYLLLPLETTVSSPDCMKIDWAGVDSCVSVVEFMKKNAWLNNTQPNADRDSLLYRRKDSMGSDNELYFANKAVNMVQVTELVVLAIHTGKMYSTVQVVDNLSAESPFDGNPEGTEDGYSSFSEYFNKKYGIDLKHPGQPLLLLKQSHNAHNLLVEFRSEGISSDKDLKKIYEKVVKKPEFHVHMPPELLVVVDVSISVVKSLYLLPSLMHRLESLMLASQLREEIATLSSDFQISSLLILEALTTQRCNEVFSLERLELLGDSVLKYAVSCHLYLKYPKKHEGQLSALRSWAVCNSTLHKVGIDRKLQGYIRDSPFDPRRWSAPGQRTMRPYLCCCGVDTQEVPIDSKFQSKDTKILIGKCCDKGHRWMGSKTISDCVEALIGAYYVGGGLTGALHLMKWLGVEAELDPSLVEDAIRTASLYSYIPKAKDIEALESKIGYMFSTKGLLLEAITHASDQESGVAYCYQRLEFLGDSVLDILITWHLYQSHKEIDPGELTDLRSASVNNESFAHAAIRKDLHPHLQHCSGFLLDQIKEFVKSISFSGSTTKPAFIAKVPKVLGDLVESIAGAVLLDTKLNLDEVWRIYKPLLSPLVTPDKLELPPFRELTELCDSHGYFIKDCCIQRGEFVHAELRVQLVDVLLVAQGVGHNKKSARARAAVLLLEDLENRGISSSKRSKQGSDADSVSSMDVYNNISCHMNGNSSAQTLQKKQKMNTNDVHLEIKSITSANPSDPNHNIPVIPPINMKKGKPRSDLYELCKKLQWPMPSFETAEQKSRTPIEFLEGSETRMGFNSFTSTITLTIPDFGVIKLTGDGKADKKSSYDSAAVLMLQELKHRGKVIIGS